MSFYLTRSIITLDLFIFYPIFHCGLNCRAAYNAKWLVFHDSFLSWHEEDRFSSSFHNRKFSTCHKIEKRSEFFKLAVCLETSEYFWRTFCRIFWRFDKYLTKFFWEDKSLDLSSFNHLDQSILDLVTDKLQSYT